VQAARDLPTDVFAKKVTPCIVKLYASTDKARPDMTKCVKVLQAKAKAALIRACDWSVLFAYAFACNTLTHFVI